jgi:hypothetical protein
VEAIVVPALPVGCEVEPDVSVTREVPEGEGEELEEEDEPDDEEPEDEPELSSNNSSRRAAQRHELFSSITRESRIARGANSIWLRFILNPFNQK